MSDLKTRLRRAASQLSIGEEVVPATSALLMKQAADRIAKLEAELAMLTNGAELPESAQCW